MNFEGSAINLILKNAKSPEYSGDFIILSGML